MTHRSMVFGTALMMAAIFAAPVNAAAQEGAAAAEVPATAAASAPVTSPPAGGTPLTPTRTATGTATAADNGRSNRFIIQIPAGYMPPVYAPGPGYGRLTRAPKRMVCSPVVGSATVNVDSGAWHRGQDDQIMQNLKILGLFALLH